MASRGARRLAIRLQPRLDDNAWGPHAWSPGNRRSAARFRRRHLVNDPFDAAKLKALKQVSGYAGHAVGTYGTEDAGIQLFTADVRLINHELWERQCFRFADERKRRGHRGEYIHFTNLKLDSISLDGFFKGSLADEDLAGNWGGQFYGDGSVAPGSIGGAFGAKNADGSESLMGVFGAYRK